MEISKQGLDLERELTCSICTEVLYQPLTLLDCLHTFCGACLKEWFAFQLNASRDGRGNQPVPGSTPFTCPSCRASVRATRKNATVTTLLEMFLTQHPDRGRTGEEIAEMDKKYRVGEEVLPKTEERERTIRERMREDEDRRLVNQVQVASLRERGLDETPEERRERRRRREERARLAGRSGREIESSRDTSRDRVAAIRSERRRDAGDSSGGEGQRRSRRDRQTASTSNIPTLHPDPEREERRRRRRERSAEESAAVDRRRDDELRRRNVEAADRSAARQIEHQSSLRSLISSSDVDTAEVEEEILRQIREEGLLDGIDLENIDAAEETRIGERIAEAFRRRQEERALFLPPASAPTMARTRERSASNREERRPVLSTRNGGTTQYPPRTEHRRQHSRSLSTRSANEEHARNPRAQFLEPQSSDETRISTRRRRETSQHSRRSATSPSPSSSPAIRGIGRAQRSNTDIADRERRMIADAAPIRPIEARTTSDPQTHQSSMSMADVVEEANRRRRGAPPALPPRDLPVREREREREPARVVAELDVASSPVELDTPRRDHVRGHSQASTPIPATTAVPAPIAANVPLPVELDAQPGLVPAPLTPTRATQGHDRTTSNTSTALERALTLSATSRPTSSSSATSNATRNLPRYPEPSISCNRCQRPHIEYDLHYSCSICANGQWNLCLPCYRSGRGCLHWFGFGYAAFTKFDKLKQAGQLPPHADPPHMLYAERYSEPARIPGGAEGRRTLTTEDPEKRLQTGAFCAGCQAWANECYWRCDICNEGDWGFCNSCVNQGRCCTHALLPLLYVPQHQDTKHDGSGTLHVVNPDVDIPPHSPVYAHPPPQHATLLEGPNAVALGSFKPLSFRALCDICRLAVHPKQERFHCYECTSSLPDSERGDYDICTPCYHGLLSNRRISPENGFQGWRRCLQGHRMVVLRFEDLKGGQRRVVERDLVGGWTLSQEPLQGGAAVTISSLHPRVEHEKWTWANGLKCRLVPKDVGATAAQVSAIPGMVVQGPTLEFPPEGGTGMRAMALWSWWPSEESRDELAFPKGSEIREVVDVNGDWFFGSFMGAKGLFPAPYVRILE